MARALAGLMLLLPLAGPITAQTGHGGGGSTRRLAAEVGGLWRGLDDAMASPLRYAGSGLVLGAALATDGPRWRWAVRIAGARPVLYSPNGSSDAGFAEADWLAGGAELLRRVWRGPARWTVWAGPGVAGELARRRHTYRPGARLDFHSAFLALQLTGAAEVDLGRYGRVSETLALPVVGMAARKEFAGAEGRDPRVTVALPPSLLLIRHRLVYRLPAGGELVAYVFHEGWLVRHDDPLELASVSHRLGVAVEWLWGAR